MINDNLHAPFIFDIPYKGNQICMEKLIFNYSRLRNFVFLFFVNHGSVGFIQLVANFRIILIKDKKEN